MEDALNSDHKVVHQNHNDSHTANFDNSAHIEQ